MLMNHTRPCLLLTLMKVLVMAQPFVADEQAHGRREGRPKGEEARVEPLGAPCRHHLEHPQPLRGPRCAPLRLGLWGSFVFLRATGVFGIGFEISNWVSYQELGISSISEF